MGAALATWLERWMKDVDAEIADLGKRGIASCIPGSRAAEILVQSRLSKAVVLIAGEQTFSKTACTCA